MIELRWNADLLAKIFGVVFIAIGILGFVPNPLVWQTGVFQVNAAHNWVHIISGAIFLIGAYANVPVMTIRWMAVLYAILAIIGFVIPQHMLFGVIEMNLADRWLHVVLAAVLLFVGFLAPARETFGRVRM